MPAIYSFPFTIYITEPGRKIITLKIMIVYKNCVMVKNQINTKAKKLQCAETGIPKLHNNFKLSLTFAQKVALRMFSHRSVDKMKLHFVKREQ